MNPRIRKIVLIVVVVLLGGGFVAWWLAGFSLDFSRFFAAEQSTDIGTDDGNLFSPTPMPFSTPPTSLVSCAPATQTISVVQVATLTATGGTGTYQWFAPNGVVQSSGGQINSEQTGTGDQITVTYTMPGTKKVTIRAERGDGSGNMDSVVCTVVVTP